jgi:hypothetical protein
MPAALPSASMNVPRRVIVMFVIVMKSFLACLLALNVVKIAHLMLC